MKRKRSTEACRMLVLAMMFWGGYSVTGQDVSTALEGAPREMNRRQIDREIKNLQRYRFGSYRGHWNTLEAQMRDQYQRNRDYAEHLLATVLELTTSSRDARILACRGLRWVGKGNVDPNALSSIDLLISLIRDAKLSAEACAVLQGKDDPGINPALREALTSVESSLKESIMVTLARRRDGEAVGVINELMRSSDDPALRKLALRSLGQIGGKPAIDALSALRRDKELAFVRDHALLSAASRALEMKDSAERNAGFAALQGLLGSSQLKTVRLGALYEMARHDQVKRMELCRRALADRSGDLLEAVPHLLALLGLEETRTLFTQAAMDSLGSRARAILLAMWEPEFGGEEVVRGLAAESETDDSLRAEARRALERRVSP